MKNNQIISQNNNFAGWYTSVIKEAKLAMYGSVKGTICFMPNGWAIWQNIVKIIDDEFQKIGVKNVQLPVFMKQSDFLKEKEHVKNFSPETFVAKAPNSSEVLIVRPTSEIAFCHCFKQLVGSYNDLPLLLNQWCNTFRVEKNTRPFLRTSEFYWQELHTLHSDEQQARSQALKSLEIYKKVLKDKLLIPFIAGRKTEGEKFAGAVDSYTLEALMPDGQALQCSTSHYLGQNFAKAYNLKFQTKNNDYQYCYQTSAGLSTRIIGALIMTHSDDNGLVLPFSIAPIQIGIVVLNDKTDKSTRNYVKKVCQNLIKKYRVVIDNNNKSIGYKINNFQVQGTPFVLVIGANEVMNKQVTIIRRDSNEKKVVTAAKFAPCLKKCIEHYDLDLYNKAKLRMSVNIVQVKNFQEFKQAINAKKMVKAYFKLSSVNEQKIKEMTGATTRCIIENQPANKCFYSGQETTDIVYFARAY